MKLLLDTHTFIWLDTAPEKLSNIALMACEDPGNDLYLSIVSAWEIQIKTQLKRLTLRVPLAEMIPVQQTVNGLTLLTVDLAHIYALQGLELYHNDPFDRLLIAQSKHEGMP